LVFNFLQEVPGMGFHISQPGSSVATSLIDGESKPKHVLLLEIKVVYIMRNLMTLS
jgi:double-strand break repair protein MRE11